MGSTPTRSRHLSLVGRKARTTPLVSPFAILAGLCLSFTPAVAQEPVNDDTAAVAAQDADSAAMVSSGSSSVVRDSVDRPVSAMGAFWRSLVLPGWGQAKVGQQGRGAFYFSMEAASLWMLFKTSQKKAAAERAGNEALAAARKDQQEDWIVMAVFWSLFAGVDAWVSAQMWDFEGAVIPPPDGSQGVAVQYSIPVNIP